MKNLNTMLSLAIIFCLTLSLSLKAQTIYTYENNVNGVAGVVAPAVTASDMIWINGPAFINACYDGMVSDSWSLETGPFSLEYSAIEFTLTPGPGASITVTGMQFDLRRNPQGPELMRYAFSNDAGLSWIDQGFDMDIPNNDCNDGETNFWDIEDFTTTTAVTFRIYGWNASIENGHQSTRNGFIYGTSTCEAAIWYADNDGDNYGDAETTIVDCVMPEGYVADNTDCNDSEVAINPGVAEVCNAIDDNCSGVADEDLLFELWYADTDIDSYGNASVSVSTCDGAPDGHVADNTDCDDTNIAVNPGALEICDGVDNDCDGSVDEDIVTAIISPEVFAFTCKGEPLTFSTEQCEGCTYQWYKNDKPLAGATNSSYSTTKPAYYSVQVTVPGGCSDVSDHTLLNLGLNPNANIYHTNGLNLCSPYPGDNIIVKVGYTATNTYQWYKDGLPYEGAGADSWRIFPLTPGEYRCSITSEAGCNRLTAIATVVDVCRLSESENLELNIYPNPSSGNINLSVNSSTESNVAFMEIYNLLGEIIYSEQLEISKGEIKESLNIYSITSNGIYILKLTIGNFSTTKSFVIEK